MKKRLSSLLGLTLLIAWPALCHGQDRILVLGDSLSAAYGIPTEYGWVALLDARLQAQGRPAEVINASISGETTAGGLARLPALLAQHTPSIVIVELGGNDGLRGYAIDQLRNNLAALLRLSREAGADGLLIGMHILPNYGRRYSEAFHASYVQVAQQEQVPLVPFLLDGIAGRPDMMQSDGIHPTALAQASMLDNVWPTLAPLLSSTDLPDRPHDDAPY